MANIKSAIKRIGVINKKTAVNKSRKTEIKTYINKFNSALDNGSIEEARGFLKVIEKKLSRAGLKNTVHKNTAARKVSRLTKRLNKAV